MLNIAIAGLGTVGDGVVRELQIHAELIAARAGQPIAIKAVSARDKNKKRDCKLDGITWVDDPLKLAALPDVHAVVELIGGTDGAARNLAEATLKNGKHLITANKALLAAHGVALANIAEQNYLQIYFEAAVCGGIPVIKTLREGLAGNVITHVRGILNGTCNYILTRMGDAKLSFDAALKEAQDKGYAEADPAADIDGHDTANKLALLIALAFGCEPDLASIPVTGIRNITQADLAAAEQKNCVVKLLGMARMTENGLQYRVTPVLAPKTSSLSGIPGAYNAVQITGDFVGPLTLVGHGAGSEPTASAVVADIIDLARGHKTPVFGIPATKLIKLKPVTAAPSSGIMPIED